MTIVFPFHAGDAPHEINLQRWITQLGGCPKHDALLVADIATPWQDVLEARDLAAKSFRSVQLLTNEQPTQGWIAGPNSLWLVAARYMNDLVSGRELHPWLWVETDAVPLKPGWADELEREYFDGRGYNSSKPKFMGPIVLSSGNGQPPRSLAGTAIYPHSAYRIMGKFVRTDEAANTTQNANFDLCAAKVVMPQATDCPGIQHLWGAKDLPPTFVPYRTPHSSKNELSLDHIRPNAVLFHRNKDGSLIHQLRLHYRMTREQPDGPFIQLGRFGDLILLFPAFQAIAQRKGSPVDVIVSKEYASVFEGVTYARALPLDVPWWAGMPKAREYSRVRFGMECVLQCHASEWGVDLKRWPNYMTSMWDRAGFSAEQMATLPLEFDRRNPERERSLVQLFHRPPKPLLLTQFSGVSSPFAFTPEISQVVNQFAKRFHIVDLSNVMGQRIFDLLGLFDVAAGLVTIDTYSLHLAAASKVPYVAYIRDDWGQSVPKGNVKATIHYGEAMEKRQLLHDTISQW